MTTIKEVDPRIERTRRVVLEAAAELIAECGFGRASIEAISERSGVARSTIYRHWPDRLELLIESVGQHVDSIETPDTGDLRTDLLQTFSRVASMLADEATKSVIASFIAESTRDSELRTLKQKFTQSRRESAINSIRKAVGRRDLPKATDCVQMADDVASGIFFRALILNKSTDEEWLGNHVDRWITLYSG